MLGEKTPKTARGRRTLRKILDAAEQEFGARGFHEASVASITANAGVAQGTFYLYFDSKELLYRELVADLGSRLRGYLAEAVADAPSRAEAERLGLAAFIGFVREHGNLYRIVMESQFVDPEAFRLYFMDFGAAYQAGLDRAVQTGEVRAGETEGRAWALMGISLFAGLRYGIWEPERDIGPLVDSITDMIARGLAPSPVAAPAGEEPR
ncbi:transcriptional regulator, TetR family [Tistlia consotensis]|uniref:Transcriptional regulator, TetR family n=2 Tax=Tistlia TaxID=1321364 RepID=A0A1Y6B5S6_9PROT|nr:TetR/AcrR family transcriptional regulator [Tistlia consotensis]SME92077.1 transcriptional regulator, TetR family [Tistlia consotensis USBA 355]SNR27820.1 transcriptional regulator, TetR family [Tistlia consotensis]